MLWNLRLNRNQSTAVTWLFSLILCFLEKFPDTQVGICDPFFSALRSVGRPCVSGGSVTYRPCCMCGCVLAGENPQQTARGLSRACAHFYQSACGCLTDKILKLPFKAKIGTNHSVVTWIGASLVCYVNEINVLEIDSDTSIFPQLADE